MGKKRKLKQSLSSPNSNKEDINSLCNISGIIPETAMDGAVHLNEFDSGMAMSSSGLDDCLAQLDEEATKISERSSIDSTTNSASERISLVKSAESSAYCEKLENLHNSITSSSLLWKNPSYSQTTTEMPSHSTSSKTISSRTSTANRREFSLPIIQVELARHKHIGEMSAFLLEKCKGLRMPTFERWLIDSKIEERAKRKEIESLQKKKRELDLGDFGNVDGSVASASRWKKRLKRKRKHMKDPLENHMTSTLNRSITVFDPVLPSMVDIMDDATQRLVEEITTKLASENTEEENMTKREATMICKELCQMTLDAARHVQNLSNHLNESKIVVRDGSIDKMKKKIANSGEKIMLEFGSTSTSSAISSSNENGTEIGELPSQPMLYSLVYSRKSKHNSGAYSSTEKKKPFVVKINSSHYEKLREMFHIVHGVTNPRHAFHVPSVSISSRKAAFGSYVFHNLVFCLLVRYSSLAGGQQLQDLRGGGMQGAINSQVFSFLNDFMRKRNFHANASSDNILNMTECFASPLNAYLPNFCSAFHEDLDWHFGSCGDFFSAPIGFYRNGVHEANPPFSPGLMDSMVVEMERHLESADIDISDASNNLTFVVVVPTCSSTKTHREGENSTKNGGKVVHEFAQVSFQRMLKSKYFTKHIVLEARKHGYVEGAQHLRPTRYKESQYDTSVLILQSKAAMNEEKKTKALTCSDFEHGLRKAFNSRHNVELKERQMKKENLDERRHHGRLKCV